MFNFRKKKKEQKFIRELEGKYVEPKLPAAIAKNYVRKQFSNLKKHD